MDTQTHLPLRRSSSGATPFTTTRTAMPKSTTTTTSSTAIQTPYTITRYKNDEMYRQFYVTKVQL